MDTGNIGATGRRGGGAGAWPISGSGEAMMLLILLIAAGGGVCRGRVCAGVWVLCVWGGGVGVGVRVERGWRGRCVYAWREWRKEG